MIERQADSPRYEDVAEAVRSELARRNAEAALKRAKQTGERFLFYTAQMGAAMKQKLELEAAVDSVWGQTLERLGA